ncbi:VPS53 [Candida pseudojiufengensis]|uniref:VPS53 n=1 Tax=Candida pseudojiufengensis TaxID=497109 RepID=UPI002225A33F|nr:VPS53 [Candida pseudojiufengensis]KAI5966305.1 VPS53 [Candida pseudojiufengensis]
MNSYDYDPNTHLNQIFDAPDTLNQIPQVLSHIHQYKLNLSKEIDNLSSKYDSTTNLDQDINQLINNIKDVKQSSQLTKNSISSMTSSIQKLDSTKRNLILSMNIFKKLQILIKLNNELKDIIQTKNYQEIYKRLTAIKELLNFFQPYKSIDLINQINLMIIYTQNKLIDDIFLDFEEFFKINNNYENLQKNENLLYGAKILEIIDNKNKIKLINWFNNQILKDLKNIFSQSDEAGSIENLGRRFIYFNKILNQIKTLVIFPENWNILDQIIKEFIKLTKNDLSITLKSRKIDSNILLDNLTKTIEFEKSLNSNYSNDNNYNISSVFEPYLLIWVQEQDKYLNSKILDFSSVSQLPIELIKDINSNIPNISITSIELFKIFHKILSQILKLSNGEILINLAKSFNKYLFEYINKILLPILPRNDDDINGIDSIKYLTMLLNTSDYMVSNIEELNEKFQIIITSNYKEFLPQLNSEIFQQLIQKSISGLLIKLTNDYKSCWREFFNIDWENLDNVSDVSSYMIDLKKITSDNCKIILSLIIRDSYIRNFNDKLIELLTTTLLNNLKFNKISNNIINLEQILLDIISLKDLCLNLPKLGQKEISKSYIKYVNNHFNELESIIKILMIPPTTSIENYIETYFEIIGDKSINNFIKLLNLKNIKKLNQKNYIENFKLQLSIENNEDTSSLPTQQNHKINHLLTNLQDDEMLDPSLSSSQFSSSPTPIQIPTSLPIKQQQIASPGSKSPQQQQQQNLIPKINQFEKNIREFALNGENHVNKIN